MSKGLAIVTGASSGIGLELARCCAEDGYELLICSDTEEIEEASRELRAGPAQVEAVQADLATPTGVDRLVGVIGERPVELLLANAGIGLGDGFLDQDLDRALRVVDLNVTGTLALIHSVGRRMRDAGRGRILITGSIAGFMPGSFQAVYNGTKAFLDSFCDGASQRAQGHRRHRHLPDAGAPPRPTSSRPRTWRTPRSGRPRKADPADVARQGYRAMMKGDSGVVTGFMNKVQAAFSGIIPDTVLAQMHRRMAEPGSGH